MTRLQQIFRSRLLRVMLVLLLVVLASDLAVGLAQPLLPRPLSWYSYWAQTKADEMSQMQRNGAEIDLVFVGSSVVIAALNPEVFTESSACELTAYNGAIAGATMRGLDHWTETIVVPSLNPSTVVIGVTSRDISTESGFFADAYFSSSALREDLGARFDRTIARFSNIVRYRSVLRDPSRLKANLDRMRGAPQESWDTTVLGWRASPANVGYTLGNFRQAEADLELGTSQIEALEALVDGLLDQGILVVLVDMAVSDDYPRLRHPAGTYPDYQEDLRNLAERMQADYVDLTEFDDQGLFVDPLHVNIEGSMLETRKLAMDLSKSVCAAQGRRGG